MRGYDLGLGIAIGLSVAASAFAQPELIDLGLLPDGRGWRPNAINADGTVIVGVSLGGTTAVRWTPSGGAQPIGIPAGAFGSEAMAVSNDGVAIALDASDAYRWTEDEGFLYLGVLPGYLNSFATDTNADGSVVVGYCNRDLRRGAFRWTADGGMVDLGSLAPGDDDVVAYGVSADGSVVVGSSTVANFRWTLDEGMVEIPPPDGPASGRAVDVSDDGQYVAMYARYRWSLADGYEPIGLADGTIGSQTYAISGDGSTLVGEHDFCCPRRTGAMLWRQDIGAVDVLEYLGDLGVDVSGWTMRRATGVSADGSAVVGWGSVAGGGGGFLVRGLPVPSACPADLDGDGELTIFDFLAFQNLFDAGDPIADFDGDGELTIFDFLAFQNAFDAGC